MTHGAFGVAAIQAWETFYILIGSAAAALTGLQFVVIALGAEANALSKTAMRAFGTPTIVHFCATLLMSAILSAPWHSVSSAAVCIGVFAVCGIAYLLRVMVHAGRQKDYVPVLEDWLWHFVFPVVAYVTFLVSALGLRRYTHEALFIAAAGALLLLFIGIHNAWDAAMYIAIDRPNTKTADRDQTGESGR